MQVTTFKRLQLLGSSIQHSWSPLIHRMFAQQFGINLQYELQAAPPQTIVKILTTAAASGISGFNITAPYKELAYQYCQYVNPLAKNVGAVNTILVQENGELCGDNTDGVGFARSLMQHAIDLKHKTILIIGSGGVVRGILPNIVAQQPHSIILSSRNCTKTAQIADFFSAAKCLIVPPAEIAKVQSDVIIHAISHTVLPTQLPFFTKINFANAIFYDLNYGANSSIFTAFAQANGAAQMLNGINMLVEQAAAAFYLWFGLKPRTHPVIAYLQQKTC